MQGREQKGPQHPRGRDLAQRQSLLPPRCVSSVPRTAADTELHPPPAHSPGESSSPAASPSPAPRCRQPGCEGSPTTASALMASAVTQSTRSSATATHGARLSHTLIFRGLLLLHGYQGREMGLVVCQYQRRAVAFVGWNFQGKVDTSKGNRGKGWKEIGLISFQDRLKREELFILKVLQNTVCFTSRFYLRFSVNLRDKKPPRQTFISHQEKNRYQMNLCFL